MRFTNPPLPGSKIKSSMTKAQVAGKKIEPVKTIAVQDPKYISKVPKNVFGGNKKFVKMEYVSDFGLDTGATPTANMLGGQVSFRCNNINLPYIGQQADMPLPNGYTQAAQAYARFKVTGIKIIAEFYDPNRDAQVGLFVTSSADTTSLQAQLVNKADMFPRCKIKTLSDTGDRKAVFKRYYNIRSLDGLDKSQFNGDIGYYSFPFNASVGGAEANEAGTSGDLIRKRVPKIHLAVASDGTTNQTTCRCKLTLNYYVLCLNKTTLPTSQSST